jgi:phenylacetate-CoA ligase
MSEQSVWMAPGALPVLQSVIRHAWDQSPFQRARMALAGVSADVALTGPESLRALPVIRKEQLGPLQAEESPFGGLLGEPVSDLARIFLSPGDLYDPQGARADYWRFGAALEAAGFVRGDLVLNCASYHLSPLGFVFDAAARSLGCVVIPAGVGQQDLQVKVLADTQATAYTGLPSYLLALLERAAASGTRLALQKALVTAEPLPPSLRARLASFGVKVFQGYGTADLGLVAYECPEVQGMHLDEGVVVEVCDPEGRPVATGEVGEVVVTLLSRTYPLLRFGTGDLSAMMPGECPCGRPAMRIRGWLGRANDVVKVRGVFVYPRQLEEAMARFVPQVAQWQAVVDRDGQHRDRLTLLVEPEPGQTADPAAIAAAVKATTRLTAAVSVAAPGALETGAARLKDRRKWD